MSIEDVLKDAITDLKASSRYLYLHMILLILSFIFSWIIGIWLYAIIKNTISRVIEEHPELVASNNIDKMYSIFLKTIFPSLILAYIMIASITLVTYYYLYVFARKSYDASVKLVKTCSYQDNNWIRGYFNCEIASPENIDRIELMSKFFYLVILLVVVFAPLYLTSILYMKIYQVVRIILTGIVILFITHTVIGLTIYKLFKLFSELYMIKTANTVGILYLVTMILQPIQILIPIIAVVTLILWILQIYYLNKTIKTYNTKITQLSKNQS